MAKKTDRAQVNPGEAAGYRSAASQFMKAAGLAKSHDYGNAAGLLFVHAAIAYADAVCIHLAGVKSTSQNHYDAAQLLSETTARLKDRDRAITHFSRLIGEKNRVSYTGQSFRHPEVEALETHARRFGDWAEAILGA